MQRPTEESKEAGPREEAGPSQAALCTAGTQGSWTCKRRRMEHQVLLLLLFLPHTSACDDLVCFADYIQTLMCMWGSGDTEARYNLTASWNCMCDGTCYFLPASGNATQTLYTCFSEQKLCFGSDTFVVEVTKFADEPLSAPKACRRAFTFQESIKPQPPFNLTTSASPAGYNISWKTHYQHFPYDYLNGQLQYQLRYRDRGRPRQEWSQKHILQDTRTLRLLRQELAGRAEYEFQVRAKPGQSSSYSGAWSEWSPPATMETLPRAPESGESRWLSLLLPLLLPLSLAAALLSFLSWPRRLWKKLDLIPSPAPFFQSLYLGHNGDFKRWAGTSHSGVMLDVFEQSAALPEVFGVGQKHFPPSPDKEDWKNSLTCPPGTPAPHLQATEDDLPEQAYGHLSIDTVTVAGEFVACCPHCDQGSPCQVPEQLQQEAAEAGDSLEGGSACGRGSFDLPPEPGWALGSPGSLSPTEEEARFYSRLLSSHLDANGEPPGGLDLDTIDSGFADCDCESSVDCESERRPSDCGANPAPREGKDEQEAFLPSYVKQWVSCHNRTQST